MFKLEMEDEYHFLTLCPAYQEKEMFYSITWKGNIL